MKKTLFLIAFFIGGYTQAINYFVILTTNSSWPYTATIEYHGVYDCIIQEGVYNISPLGIYPNVTFGNATSDITDYSLTIRHNVGDGSIGYYDHFMAYTETIRSYSPDPITGIYWETTKNETDYGNNRMFNLSCVEEPI